MSGQVAYGKKIKPPHLLTVVSGRKNENIYRFSIFYPEGVYGNVTGYIDLPTLPKVGEAIVLFKDELSRSGVRFSGLLHLKAILPVEGYGPEYTVYALEDAEMNSLDDARKLGNRLEAECGLFCDAYHDD